MIKTEYIIDNDGNTISIYDIVSMQEYGMGVSYTNVYNDRFGTFYLVKVKNGSEYIIPTKDDFFKTCMWRFMGEAGARIMKVMVAGFAADEKRFNDYFDECRKEIETLYKPVIYDN